VVSTLSEAHLELIKRLIERLERLSADSTFAHQASGLRGSLLRVLQRIEDGTEMNTDELNQLIESGFKILNNAAKELGGSNE
jgi:hypothetical protein